MLKEIHHVAIYGMDLPPVEGFLGKYFGIKPLKLEGADEPPSSPKPLLAIFQIGPTLLEFMQPRARFGINYDYVRRNGGPVYSHIAWKVEDITKRMAELVSRGADLWWTKPGTSPHGGYHFDNIFAETTRAVKFQFCEDLKPDEVAQIEKEGFRTHTVGQQAIKYEPSAGGLKGQEKVSAHRWLVRTQNGSAMTHVHHVCYHLWGVDYLVDFIEKMFQVEPLKREDLPNRGLRGVSFRFGSTIAQFMEPTQFGNPISDFALRFGPHSGLIGGGVSHVGWAVKDLDKQVAELKKGGVKFAQDKPMVSPHGGYRLIDTLPEVAGGLKFQLCEDI